MIVYFGTVIRKAPVEKGGEIVKLDWKSKRVMARHDVIPGPTDVTRGPNKRGQARGCRGIDFAGDMVTGANYHSIECYTPKLEKIKTVTNDMMVGLHETHHVGEGKVWVTSTAIDAAFLVDLETSEILDEYWPREYKEFQERLDLCPLTIDKSADNRDKFLDLHVAKDKSHVHLNGVQQHKDEVYALFNRQGVVVNLTTK